MDVWGVYVNDSSMPFAGTARGAYYRDYELFPYGSLEQSIGAQAKDPYSRVQEKCQRVVSEKSQKKKCPFCNEQKKRPLTNYMRKRESRQHHESICEDEEEEEENTHHC